MHRRAGTKGLVQFLLHNSPISTYLREFLELRLHHKVDLVMGKALKPTIGKRILSEVEYV